MALTGYDILDTFLDEPSPKWAARLRFTGDEEREAVFRFGTTEPTAPEIEAAALTYIGEYNADEQWEPHKFHTGELREAVRDGLQRVLRRIITYVVANPTCTPAQVMAHLDAELPTAPFDWPKLFAWLQSQTEIASFAALRDYIVAHADQAGEPD